MPQQNKWSNGLNNIRYHGATVSMRSYSRTTDVANITKNATTKQLIQQIEQKILQQNNWYSKYSKKYYGRITNSIKYCSGTNNHGENQTSYRKPY